MFSTAPTSQVGPIVANSLVITNLPAGFVVTGDVRVAAPPTGGSGILVRWEIDRPLDPAFFTGGSYQTTTFLDGFSAPPAGVVANTGGNVGSYFTDPTVSVPSISNIPVLLPGGVAVWSSLSVSSLPFIYTASSGGFVLRQIFILDGVYVSGPGGNWIIDVPVRTSYQLVPEPASAAALVAIAGMVLARRRRSSRVALLSP